MPLKEIGLQVAKTAGDQVVNTGMGLLQEALQGNRLRRKQREQQQAYTDMQFRANSDMLKLQEQSNKNMFDYTYKTAGDKKDELMSAGLNPALMYGGSMAGGGGSTSGGSGGSAGMGHENEGAVQSALMERQAMGLQLEMQRQQIRNLKAEEDKTKGETKNLDKDIDLKDITIENITQDIENKKVQREGYKLQNNYDEMRNALQQGSFNDNLKFIEYEAKKAEANWKKILEETKNIKEDTHGRDIDNRLKLQNFDKLAEKIRLENELLIADIFVKGSQGRLNNEEANAISKELGMQLMQIGINMDKVSADKQFNKIYMAAAELAAQVSRDNNLDSNITTAISTLLGIIALTAGKKPGAKPVKGFGR